MPQPVRNVTQSATPLQRDILRTLLYFDMFRHPLDAAEIYRFLPSDSTSPDTIDSACRKPPLSELISEDGGFFYITGNDGASPVAHRRRNEMRARRFIIIARFMTAIIRRFPFVRGLYISGELSKGVLSKNGDIDFVVVTAPGRVWICRTALILFKKIILLNRKRFFCINHLVAEDYLEVTHRNLYTAMEIATLRPLFNEHFLIRYLDVNPWILKFLPNAKLNVHRPPERIGVSLVQRVLELPFQGRIGDILDSYLLKMWKNIWRKRYPWLSDEKRSQLFRTERSISTAYAGDFLTRIESEYSRRLSIYHLQDRREFSSLP